MTITNQPYRSKERFNSRTTLSLFVFLIFTFVALYIFGIIPVPRIPSEWYSRSVQVGVDPNAKITRGAIEAKKNHKPHVAINLDTTHLPSKYITSPTGLPLGNYVVMIDAGSSGSRVYVYQYKLPFSLNEQTNQPIYGQDPSADILHVTVAEDVNHNPIVRKQEPGLSSFHKNPQDAFSSIEPLLSFASENIPKSMHSKTPIYIMATAGLRLISEESRHKILDNLRAGLRKWSERGVFKFTSDDQADMITGEQEGLYGWIALNYVYNRFGDLKRTYPTGGLDPHNYAPIPRLTPDQFRKNFDHYQSDKSLGRPAVSVIVDAPSAPSDVSGTVALLEIGGGSAQVAFAVNDGPSSHPPNYVYSVDLNLLHCDYATNQISDENSGKKNSDTIEYRTDRDGQRWPVGGHNYSVYTASFLGHGANAARTRYINFLLKRNISNNNGSNTIKQSLLLDPCGIYGQADVVTPKNGWGKSYKIPYSVQKTFKSFESSHFFNIDTSFLQNDEILVVGTGNWAECRKILPQLLPPTPPELESEEKRGLARCEFHCPINDQYQPKLTPELLNAMRFFGFSEYWFLTRDVIRIDPADFSSELFDLLSQELCDAAVGKQDWETVLQKFHDGQFPDSANEQRIRQQCFKGAWMATMLHEGHGLPTPKPEDVKKAKGHLNRKAEQKNNGNTVNQVITPVSSIEGSEVQWSLGAVLLKVTQKLKQDRGFCLDLAHQNNKNGLASLLNEAKQSFESDEQSRLAQTDYWGSDAGWTREVFAWLWFILVMSLATICVVIWLYQSIIGRNSNTGYTSL